MKIWSKSILSFAVVVFLAFRGAAASPEESPGTKTDSEPVLSLHRAVPVEEGKEAPEGYARMSDLLGGNWYVAPDSLFDIRRDDVVKVEALEGDDVYSLRLTMTPQAAKRFNQLTRRTIDQYLAIVTEEGTVLSAPKVTQPIEGREVIISARFDEKTVNEYAERFGLPLQKVAPRVPTPSWVKDPKHKEAFALGFRNRPEEAIEAYEALLDPPPEDPVYRFHLQQELASLYLNAGRKEEARKTYEAALATEPPITLETLGPTLSCYHGLINLALADGDREGARRIFNTALDRLQKMREAAPESELGKNALLQIGYLQLKYGDLAKAREAANGVIEAGMGFQGYVLLGLLAEIEGDPMKALPEYAMAGRADRDRMDMIKQMINRAAQGGGNVKGLRQPLFDSGD